MLLDLLLLLQNSQITFHSTHKQIISTAASSMLQRTWVSTQSRQQRCMKMRPRALGFTHPRPDPKPCGAQSLLACSSRRQPQEGSVAAQVNPCTQQSGSATLLADVLQQRSFRWAESSQGAWRQTGLHPRWVADPRKAASPKLRYTESTASMSWSNSVTQCCSRNPCAVACCAVLCAGGLKGCQGCGPLHARICTGAQRILRKPVGTGRHRVPCGGTRTALRRDANRAAGAHTQVMAGCGSCTACLSSAEEACNWTTCVCTARVTESCSM